MKKIINALIIALALAFVLPVVVEAKEETDIQCMCNGGEECRHGLPARTFATFEEWEDYYFTHRRIGIYWDSYLYRSYAYRYDANKKVVYVPPISYPFEDIETWKSWLETCGEKSRTGIYKYEWPFGQARK